LNCGDFKGFLRCSFVKRCKFCSRKSWKGISLANSWCKKLWLTNFEAEKICKNIVARKLYSAKNDTFCRKNWDIVNRSDFTCANIDITDAIIKWKSDLLWADLLWFRSIDYISKNLQNKLLRIGKFCNREQLCLILLHPMKSYA
jgi:hypothetical protein